MKCDECGKPISLDTGYASYADDAVKICLECDAMEQPLSALGDREGGPTDPLSENYVKPVAGGPRIPIPARKIPR